MLNIIFVRKLNPGFNWGNYFMLLVFQLFFILLLFIFIGSQIILPSFNNNYRYFWLFKKKLKEYNKIESELYDSFDDRKTIKLRKDLRKVQKINQKCK